MKRASASTLEGEAKRLTIDGGSSSSRAATNFVVKTLFAHSPALAAPPPRSAWGLDRLILDGRCAEDAVRTFLQAGGSELPRLPPKGSLWQSTVLSLSSSGQGLAAAVGLAIGQRHLAASYSQPDFPLFEHRVFVVCNGAALPSGVVSEASSLAGHLRLGSLVVLCIDDGNLGAHDKAKRFGAYGWHVHSSHSSDRSLGSAGLDSILEQTRQAEQPTLILLRGATEESEASAQVCIDCVERGAAQAGDWRQRLVSYGAKYPEAYAEIQRRFSGELPKGWSEGLPTYSPGDRAEATRQSSAKVLASLVTAIPEMVGGSADLTGSNLTNQGKLKDFQYKRPDGRYIRFGVREHGMMGICTGLAAYGGFVPYCSTFLNFVTYGWGALRTACELSAHVIYVATHDSIELGEDGPTHQPIEVFSALRAMPNLLTIRPADGTETAGAYELAMKRTHGPTLLALSRSGTPHLQGTSRASVDMGAYVISNFGEGLVPLVVLAASGTEVATCIEAKSILQSIGLGVRVVSMPSWEIFEDQDPKYRQSIFEPSFPDDAPMPQGMRPLRVYVEASSTLGMHRYADLQLGMTQFGASAPSKDCRKHFGFEKNAIASKILDSLKALKLVDSYRVGRFGFCKFGAAIRAAMVV